MITGYNTDVRYRDVVFHVQTEDKGSSNPCIESLVYVGGRVVARKRAGYRSLLEDGKGEHEIVVLMEGQHRAMIDEIRTGRLDDQVTPLAAGQSATQPSSAASSPLAAAEGSGTLDQVILDYLNSEATQEQLVVSLRTETDLTLGSRVIVLLEAKSSLDGSPVADARISVKMISTTSEPLTLASGRTDGQGALKLDLPIPRLRKGTAALIITARSSLGTAEIKQLL